MFARACTLSGVTPPESRVTVASISRRPPAVPLTSGRPLATAGSKSATVPRAVTCAVSCASFASNVISGMRPPMMEVSVNVPFALASMSLGSVPCPCAVTWPLIVLA